MLDGWYNKFPANKKKLDLPNTIENLQVEQWLYYFKNSDFVITDSFHGTCMAILFNKPFIAIGNPARGSSRFESLLGAFNLWNRYAERPEDILKNDAFLKPVDYAPVNAAIEAQRKTSLAWLKNALEQKGGSVLLPLSYRAKSWLGRKVSSGKYLVKRVAKKILKRG